MQCVMRQHQCNALLLRKPILDKGKIAILVTAVNFIAYDGMTKVGKMDSDLMFASRSRKHAKHGERRTISLESLFNQEFRLCGHASGHDAILDGHPAL